MNWALGKGGPCSLGLFEWGENTGLGEDGHFKTNCLIRGRTLDWVRMDTIKTDCLSRGRTLKNWALGKGGPCSLGLFE